MVRGDRRESNARQGTAPRAEPTTVWCERSADSEKPNRRRRPSTGGPDVRFRVMADQVATSGPRRRCCRRRTVALEMAGTRAVPTITARADVRAPSREVRRLRFHYHMNVSLMIVERHSSLAVMGGGPPGTGSGAAFAPSISDRCGHGRPVAVVSTGVHGRSSVSASRRFHAPLRWEGRRWRWAVRAGAPRDCRPIGGHACRPARCPRSSSATTDRRTALAPSC